MSCNQARAGKRTGPFQAAALALKTHCDKPFAELPEWARRFVESLLCSDGQLLDGRPQEIADEIRTVLYRKPVLISDAIPISDPAFFWDDLDLPERSALIARLLDGLQSPEDPGELEQANKDLEAGFNGDAYTDHGSVFHSAPIHSAVATPDVGQSKVGAVTEYNDCPSDEAPIKKPPTVRAQLVSWLRGDGSQYRNRPNNEIRAAFKADTDHSVGNETIRLARNECGLPHRPTRAQPR